VPEHAEHEAPVGVLDRLDGAVALRACRDAEAGADARDALVVIALDRDARGSGGDRGELSGSTSTA
jgi:hypothetical protein